MSVLTDRLDVQGAKIRLIAQHKNARQPVRELNQDITVLGSGEGCDLILASSKVDAAHAVIIRLNEAAYLCDLGAWGGTRINSRLIRWARLADGDLPELGPFKFKVELKEGWRAGQFETPTFSLRNDGAIGVVRNVDPVLVIGSDAGCDVVLREASIAPRHAIIAWTQSGPILRDLHRRQGVRINGRKVDIEVLKNHDRVGIGRFEMTFEISNAEGISGAASDAPPAGRSQGRTARAEPSSPIEIAEDIANTIRGSLEAPLVTLGSSVTGRADDCEDDLRVGAERVGLQTQVEFGGTVDARNVAQREQELKARFTAAQNALDERARKLWDGLEAERRRLLTYQEELQQRSQELLKAAVEKFAELQTKETGAEGTEPSRAPRVERERFDAVAPEPIVEGLDFRDGVPMPSAASEPSDPSADAATLERLFSGPFEPEAATLRNAEETARLAEKLVKEGVKTPEADTKLAQQATELAELVRREREEMEGAEARLETLQFELERLQANGARTTERRKSQEAQLETRMQAIRATQAELRAERDELAAKVRQLEAKEAALKARTEEAERIRRALERETRSFAHVQEEYEERRRELRLTIESERHRLRVRQADLHKKAAELVDATKQKRRLIEAEVSARQAEIEQREIELHSQRTALEDAGRAQLQKTAVELEQVLSVRLNDIESDIAGRQMELDRRMNELTASGGNAQDEIAAEATAALEITHDEIAALSRIQSVTNKGEDNKLEALQAEVEALRRAVATADAQEETLRQSSREGQLAALSSRRSQLQREQRWASILRNKLNEKLATLRSDEESAAISQDNATAAEELATASDAASQ